MSVMRVRSDATRRWERNYDYIRYFLSQYRWVWNAWIVVSMIPFNSNPTCEITQTKLYFFSILIKINHNELNSLWPIGDMCQQRTGSILVQVRTYVDLSSVTSCGIHLRTYWHEMHEVSMADVNLNIINSGLQPHLPGNIGLKRHRECLVSSPLDSKYASCMNMIISTRVLIYLN